MSLPTTTVLGTLALGSVGAVLAAGAALTGPSPSPRSDQQPVTVTSPSALPCPAGTQEKEDECVKTVLAPAPVVVREAQTESAATQDASDDPTDEPSDEPSDDATDGPDDSDQGEDSDDGEHESEDADDDSDDDSDEDSDHDDDSDEHEDEHEDDSSDD